MEGMISEEITQVENLIDNVRILKKKSDENPILQEEKYNFFRFLGLSHDECVFSMMIANLLNVKEAHGFGAAFLKEFIQILPSKDIPNNLIFENSKVVIEKDIGPRIDKEKKGGRIDIFIEIPDSTGNNWAFIIENKIYAEDQNLQLKRYKNYADQLYPNRNFIIYLTLNGKSPSEESVDIDFKELDKNPEKQYWIQISYQDFIKKWLEKCIESIGDKNLRVRENVKQF